MTDWSSFSGKLAPFPRERFLTFLGQLKVQSKDLGLVPFRLLGTQKYILDQLCAGMDEGISTYYILKSRQIGCCHDPSMRVLTADLRWKPIGDIAVADRLVACDEELPGRWQERRLRTADVLGTGRAVRSRIRILLDDGTVLIATPEHPYLCFQDGGQFHWRQVKDFRLGTKIRLLVKPWDDDDSRETGWFGGLIDGEGCLRRQDNAGVILFVSQTEGAVLDAAKDYVDQRGYRWRSEIDRRLPGDTSKLGSKEVHKIIVNRIDELFRLLGTTRPHRFIGQEWWNDKGFPSSGNKWRTVIGLEPIGDGEVVDLHTSTGTYICEGVVSHNTTFFLAVDLFWAFEHRGLLGTFVLHKEEARDDWRQTIDTFFHEIPQKAEIDGQVMKFRPSLQRHNRNILAFSNGSRFRYMIAGTQENRKGGLGRGTASNYTHCSENAFYGSESDLKAFRSSLSALYPYRLAIYETTGNGFNFWEEAYRAAKDSPAIRRMFVGWWRDERNAFGLEHPLFKAYCPDRKLNSFERARVRAVKREYDFDITLPQLAWCRWKLAEDFDGDESTFLQEYPFTDDDAFQATGSKYFTGESLTEAIKAARQSPFQTYRYRLGMRFEETVVVGDIRDLKAELRIWEHVCTVPSVGHYVIGCDPAYGSSDRADRTVISVWRAYADHLVQVAEFATPQVSTYQCAWVLAHLAGFYGRHEVKVILEINGPGMAVFQELEQLRQKVNEMRPNAENKELRNIFAHMSHYLYKKPDSLAGDLAYHWKTTDDLKRRVMAAFKDALELRRVVPRSLHLLEECRHIVNDEGHIEAEGGYKDDRVMAAALAHEAWRMWQVQKLRNMGMTVARAREIEAQGGEKPIDMHIRDYLKRQNIGSQKAGLVQPWQRGR